MTSPAPTPEPGPRLPHGHAPALILLTAVWLVQVGTATRTYRDWWFEDDTPHLVFVRDNPAPLGYFLDKDLVHKLSLGHAVTPWFPFTFWVDRQVDPLSPRTAYLHTAVSLLATAFLLYFLMARFTDRLHALAMVSVWLWLPSTVVITEFLSTRHYLEGLAFSAASLLAAQKAVRQESYPYFWFSAIFYLLACTAKEVYVSTTLVLLLGYYLLRRRFSAMAAMFGCGLLYAGYRFWALGLVGKNLSGAFLEDYHLFLARLPYILTGNLGGYLLFAAGIAVCVALWRAGKLSATAGCWFLANIGVALLTIFPVTANITHQYRELGTWYRVVFLSNTLFLASLAWPFFRLAKPKLSLAFFLAAAACAVWGGWRTAERWDHLKAEYFTDARFYCDHPDRLLFSSLPAPWFLWGVHHLYQDGLPMHYLSWRVDNGTPKDYVLARTEQYREIWVKDRDGYRADSELISLIRWNCLQGITPLNKPRQPTPE